MCSFKNDFLITQVNRRKMTSQPQFLNAPVLFGVWKLWESHGSSPEHIQGDESLLPPATCPVCSPSCPKVLSAPPSPHMQPSPLTMTMTPLSSDRHGNTCQGWLHCTNHSDNSPNKTVSFKPQTTIQGGWGTQRHRKGKRGRERARERGRVQGSAVATNN